jgi:hypothetical protein
MKNVSSGVQKIIPPWGETQGRNSLVLSNSMLLPYLLVGLATSSNCEVDNMSRLMLSASLYFLDAAEASSFIKKMSVTVLMPRIPTKNFSSSGYVAAIAVRSSISTFECQIQDVDFSQIFLPSR